jgi:hypothetical protein
MPTNSRAALARSQIPPGDFVSVAALTVTPTEVSADTCTEILPPGLLGVPTIGQPWSKFPMAVGGTRSEALGIVCVIGDGPICSSKFPNKFSKSR